jgi:hypothetical protein
LWAKRGARPKRTESVVRKNSATVKRHGPRGCTRGEIRSIRSAPPLDLIVRNCFPSAQVGQINHSHMEGKGQAQDHRATTPAASPDCSLNFNSDDPNSLLNSSLTCPKGSDDVVPSQNLIHANAEASNRCGEELIKWRSFCDNIDSPTLCADTSMALFNSLIASETSLFFKINSLFRILGNFGKKHRCLLGILMSQTPNQALNPVFSL